MELVKLPGLGTPVSLNGKINGSKYFTWGEALHDGLRIPPDWQVTANIIAAALRFDEARARLGEPMVRTSWLRDSASNAASGGATNSYHLTGRALDFYCPELSAQEIYSKLDSWWLGGLGLYPSWVHIDIGDRSRW